MPVSPEPDRVLSGRYRLESRLGEGGMGQIWRAEHLVLGAPVAVKIIDRDMSKDEEGLARFTREAQSAAALRSPHVVQIFDYGIDEGLPYIVMELLEGETLAQRIKRLQRLTPADTARLLTHVARAISRAHEAGVVHRDLKPENVFLVQNEDAEIAKVLDFGVAKVSAATLGPKGERTRTGSLLGTPFYMSPEQAQGNREVDFRTDLWALGVIAFECLTGKRPFESDGLGDLVLSICVRPIPIPSEIGPVPVGFDEWFARATAREPEARFQSARELAETLRDVLLDDAAEVQVTVPEGDEEWGAAPKAKSEGPTVRVDAPTIEAPPPESTLQRARPSSVGTARTLPGEDAIAEALRESTPTGPRPGAILAVAALFLALGAGAGVLLFARKTPDVADEVSATSTSVVDGPRATGGKVGVPIAGGEPSSTVAAPVGSEDPRDARPTSSAASPTDTLDAGRSAVKDAAVDGLSPSAQRALEVMKGLDLPDASGTAPTETPAPPPSGP